MADHSMGEQPSSSNSSDPIPSPKGARALPILALSLVVVGMGQTIVFAVLPMLGRELGFHEIAINGLVSGAALMYFLSAPRWGRLSDRFGRRPMIIVGLVGGVCCGTMVFNFSANLGLTGVLSGVTLYCILFLSRMGLAAIMCAVQPASMAYVADSTTVEKRTIGLSRMSAANGIGAMLGPSLTIFATISLLAPLYIHASLGLLAAVLVFFFLPESRDLKERRSEKKLSYFDPRYRDYIFVGVIMHSMMAVFQQTLGYYFQDTLHLTTTQTTQFYDQGMIVSSGVMLVTQLFIIPRVNWEPARLLQVGVPMLFISFVITIFAREFWMLAIAMGFFGLGMGLSGPGYAAGASLKVTREEQGSIAGLISAAPGLGYVIGPIVGASVYQISPQAPYILATIVFIPLIIYLWRNA